MSRILTLIVWSINVLSFILILTIGYWLLYPYKVIVFNDKVFPILNKTVKAGDTVVYRSNYCKFLPLPSFISRSFQNELIFVTPATFNNRPVGCHTIDVAVPIPKELPAGHFKMVQIYEYQVNPLRKITVTESTDFFNVIN